VPFSLHGSASSVIYTLSLHDALPIWEEDGLIKERWVLNTQPHLSVILLVFRPVNLKRGEKRPAIFCAHGHGAYGKDPVMGLNFRSEEHTSELQSRENLVCRLLLEKKK